MSKKYLLQDGKVTGSPMIKLEEMCAKYLYPQYWSRLYVGRAVDNFQLKQGEDAVLDLLAFIEWAEKTKRDLYIICTTILHDLACAGQPLFSPRSSGYLKILNTLLEEK